MTEAQLECQPTQDTTRADIAEINQLQAAFNLQTGIRVEGKDLRNRSYNPVIDRWHIESLWRKQDDEDLEQYISQIHENIRTNLMERMFAVETYGRFDIKGEHLYSELFPNESFGQVLLRGANWRADHGSLEQEREGILGELAGWLTINKKLVEGPVGTKMVALSPPGMIKDTSYDGKYLDVFEKVEDKEGPYVKRMRIAVDFDDKGYEQTALLLDPAFFDNRDDRPLDAWYLSHPVEVTGIPYDALPLPKTAMSQEEFGRLYEQMQKSGFVDYYIKTITKQPVDWKEVAKAFNTILTVADKIKDGQSIVEIMADAMPISLRRDRGVAGDSLTDGDDLEAFVGILGMLRVKQVGGGGCPPNRGFDFVDLSNPLSQLPPKDLATLISEAFGDNSVGKFGFNEKTWEYHEGFCRLCTDKKKKQVGPCEICKEHEAEFNSGKRT